jgi:spore coat polysaccharide biosynthesis protein SpsF
MMRAGIILQARVGSSRLPGKALATIGGSTILEICLRRLSAAGAGPVVLATTTGPEDDALEAIATRLDALVYRGDVNDVLGRYVKAASAFDLDTIVRATGDNPCTDILAAGRVLQALQFHHAEYVCENGLPYGAGVEVVTRAALVRADREATRPDDREHVTLYVRHHPRTFRVVTVPAPAALCRTDLRVTVDTAADLEHVRELYAATGSSLPSLSQIIDVADGRRRVGVSADRREVA